MQQSLFNTHEVCNMLPFDGEALFYPDFLTEEESQHYFNQLLHKIVWSQQPIIIYNKEVMQPRLTAFCGDNDRGLDYSKTTIAPQPWTPELLEIRQRAEAIAGIHFTHALLNLYRDGKDSVSWHRDNERSWGVDPVIGSVSLGAVRTFQIRNYKDKHITRSVELTPGSFLLMRGAMQRYWEHQVPKTTKRIGARINITFRILI